jgi:hypothetical protein
MNHFTQLFLRVTIAVCLLGSVQAQVPSVLNYQGRVTIGGTNFNGTGQFKFALVNGDGTVSFWQNDGATSEGEPAASVSVNVVQGLYSALLGDTALPNMAAIPPTVFTNDNVNLRVWFSRGANGFVQLSPDQRIGAAGYALRAAAADAANITNVSGNLSVLGTLSAGQLIGGSNNRAEADLAFIGGGSGNIIDSGAINAVISGGSSNAVGQDTIDAVVGGGSFNFVESGTNATIAGGTFNLARGIGATVAGGAENWALGDDTFAAGVQAKATNVGSFVWSGTYGTDTVSTNDYSFTVRAPGGVRFITTEATTDLDIGGTITNGVALAPGSGSWTTLSDFNAKENFAPIDPAAVLAKVAAMPVMTWNYKTQASSIRHLGPTAQDFKRAFGVGESDTGISSVDADGVALAAIQGLIKELKDRDKAIDELKSKLKVVEERLDLLPPAPSQISVGD